MKDKTKKIILAKAQKHVPIPAIKYRKPKDN